MRIIICSKCSDVMLMHHGIKGQRWGVRRFQKKDGSLTSAGRRRYDDDAPVGKRSSGSGVKSQSSGKAKKPNLIQRHKSNLIKKYMEKGYSKSAAEVAAKQRMKAEIIVGSVATVAVAVIATKAIKRIGEDYFDKTIKSGKMIQNIGARSNTDFNDTPFFAAINRSDKRAYGKLYPREKRYLGGGDPGFEGIFKNQIKLTKNVKRASVANARKILYEKMNADSAFKKDVFDAFKNTQYGHDINESVFKKNPKKFYDRFNQALATPEFQSRGLHKQFYSILEKKGYNALLDINDTRYSGYKKISKSPTIFFGKDFVEKVASTKLDDATIDKNHNDYILKEFLPKQFFTKYGTLAAAGIAALNISDTQKVEKYLKEHPNSKLSREEILQL